MKEEIKAILGKHKVIGDTTYGLGYAEAEQLTNEIIAFFTRKVESVEDVLMLQYKNALQNKEDGEANGYAHSLAIVKDLHREFIPKKFPYLRVYGCPDHEPDEHFCDEEVKSFLSSLIDEYRNIIKEKICEHSFDTTADVEFVLSALNL